MRKSLKVLLSVLFAGSVLAGCEIEETSGEIDKKTNERSCEYSI